jgi:hypothetical protein
MDACEEWMVEAGVFAAGYVFLDDVGADEGDAEADNTAIDAATDAADDGVLQDAL